MYDLEKGEIFVSRDVVFHENSFPFQRVATMSSPNTEHVDDFRNNSGFISTWDDDFDVMEERGRNVGETNGEDIGHRSEGEHEVRDGAEIMPQEDDQAAGTSDADAHTFALGAHFGVKSKIKATICAVERLYTLVSEHEQIGRAHV